MKGLSYNNRAEGAMVEESWWERMKSLVWRQTSPQDQIRVGCDGENLFDKSTEQDENSLETSTGWLWNPMHWDTRQAVCWAEQARLQTQPLPTAPELRVKATARNSATRSHSETLHISRHCTDGQTVTQLHCSLISQNDMNRLQWTSIAWLWIYDHIRATGSSL